MLIPLDGWYMSTRCNLGTVHGSLSYKSLSNIDRARASAFFDPLHLARMVQRPKKNCLDNHMSQHPSPQGLVPARFRDIGIMLSHCLCICLALLLRRVRQGRGIEVPIVLSVEIPPGRDKRYVRAALGAVGVPVELVLHAVVLAGSGDVDGAVACAALLHPRAELVPVAALLWLVVPRQELFAVVLGVVHVVVGITHDILA